LSQIYIILDMPSACEVKPRLVEITYLTYIAKLNLRIQVGLSLAKFKLNNLLYLTIAKLNVNNII
jgi:hypothetical protein